MRILLFITAVFITGLSFAQAPQLVIPKGHAADLSVLAISPDKKWLASGDDKGTVKLWDMQTAKEVKTFDNNQIANDAKGNGKPICDCRSYDFPS